MLFKIELTEDSEYIISPVGLSAFGINTNPNLALKECISQIKNLRDELRKAKLDRGMAIQLQILEEEIELLARFDKGYDFTESPSEQKWVGI